MRSILAVITVLTQFRWVLTPCCAFLNPHFSGSLTLTHQGWIPCRCQKDSCTLELSQLLQHWKLQLSKEVPAEAEAFYQAVHQTASVEPGAVLDQLRYWVLSPASTKCSFSYCTWDRLSGKRESTHRERACISLCTSTGHRSAKHPSWPANCGDIQPGRLLGIHRRTCAHSHGSCRGTRKTLTEQLRSSGNAPHSSDGRQG